MILIEEFKCCLERLIFVSEVLPLRKLSFKLMWLTNLFTIYNLSVINNPEEPLRYTSVSDTT